MCPPETEGPLGLKAKARDAGQDAPGREGMQNAPPSRGFLRAPACLGVCVGCLVQEVLRTEEGCMAQGRRKGSILSSRGMATPQPEVA